MENVQSLFNKLFLKTQADDTISTLTDELKTRSRMAEKANSLVTALNLYRDLDDQIRISSLSTQVADVFGYEWEETVEGACRFMLTVDSWLSGSIRAPETSNLAAAVNIANQLWDQKQEGGSYEKPHQIATIRGIPLYVYLEVRRPITGTKPFYDVSYWLAQSIGDSLEDRGIAAQIIINVDETSLEPTSCTFMHDGARFSPFVDFNANESFALDWDVIAEEADARSFNDSILYDLVGMVSSSGMPAKDEILAYLDNYSLTAIAIDLKERLVSNGSWSIEAILAAVASVMRDAGTYDQSSGRDYFSPVTSSSFDTNILGTVVALVAAAVSVILTRIFKSLSIIIAVVMSLISGLAQWFSEAVTKTKSSVETALSPLPVFSWIPITRVDLNQAPGWARKTINDFGVAAGFTDDTNLVVLTSDNPNGGAWAQVMLSGRKYTCDRSIRSQVQVTGEIYNLRITATSLFPDDTNQHHVDDGYNYMLTSDEAFRRALCDGLLGLVIKTIKLSHAWSLTSTLFEGTVWFDPRQGDLTVFFTNYMSQHADIPVYTRAILLWTTWGYEDDPTARANWLPSWDQLYSMYNSQFFRDMVTYCCGSQFGVQPAWVVSGIPAYKPAINWPERSANSLFSTLMVTAIAAGVAVSGAVAISRLHRRKAISRLALGEAQFNSAAQKYAENPTAKNAKTLARANTKLNRAWSRAGKAGVKSYNGFACSPSSEVVTGASELIAPISTLFPDLRLTPAIDGLNNGRLEDTDKLDKISDQLGQLGKTCTENGDRTWRVYEKITGSIPL